MLSGQQHTSLCKKIKVLDIIMLKILLFQANDTLSLDFYFLFFTSIRINVNKKKYLFHSFSKKESDTQKKAFPSIAIRANLVFYKYHKGIPNFFLSKKCLQILVPSEVPTETFQLLIIG